MRCPTCQNSDFKGMVLIIALAQWRPCPECGGSGVHDNVINFSW